MSSVTVLEQGPPIEFPGRRDCLDSPAWFARRKPLQGGVRPTHARRPSAGVRVTAEARVLADWEDRRGVKIWDEQALLALETATS